MKKFLNQAMIFAIYGLCCGVYYREFTKLNGYTARTMLGMAHPHVLMLGLGGFLILALFAKDFDFSTEKKAKIANRCYTIGLVVASAMMLVRGTMEVAGMEITSMVSGMISGIAGLGHIAVAIGMILFLNAIKKVSHVK